MHKANYAPILNTTANLDRGPSPNCLGQVPFAELQINPGKGLFQFDDFDSFPYLVGSEPTLTTQVMVNGKYAYKAFASSGGTITKGTGADTVSATGNTALGEWILTETDDNQGYSLATVGLPFRINPASRQNVACEARMKTGTITTLDQGFIFGLWEEQTLSATIPIAAAGTLADANFVGFHKLEASTTNIATVYKANGVTQVTGSDVLTAATTGIIAVNTYFKLGFVFDAASRTLRWYFNGVQVGTPYTFPSTVVDGNPFPNDVNLGLCLASLGGTAAGDAVTTIDWWGAGQWTP